MATKKLFITTDNETLLVAAMRIWQRQNPFTDAVSVAKTLHKGHEAFEKRAVEDFRKSVEDLPKEKSAAVRCIRRVATIGLQSGWESSPLSFELQL